MLGPGNLTVCPDRLTTQACSSHAWFFLEAATLAMAQHLKFAGVTCRCFILRLHHRKLKLVLVPRLYNTNTADVCFLTGKMGVPRAKRFPPSFYKVCADVVSSLTAEVVVLAGIMQPGKYKSHSKVEDFCLTLAFFLRKLLSLASCHEVFKLARVALEGLYQPIKLGRTIPGPFRLLILRVVSLGTCRGLSLRAGWVEKKNQGHPRPSLWPR
jgi:hypothetical protein